MRDSETLSSSEAVITGLTPGLGIASVVGGVGVMVRVRHFTNSSGLRGIQQSGVIRAGDKGRVFAVPARGKPGSPRDVERTLGLRPGRGRNYVEFNASPDEFEIVTNPGTGAREFRFRGDVDLTERNPFSFKR